jgi:two-component system nitrate/nitrite response regulator NarL
MSSSRQQTPNRTDGLVATGGAARLPCPPAAPPQRSVVVADHQQAFAEGLAIILDAQDGMSVLGVAHDSPRAVQLAAHCRPAVLLLDASLPGGDPATTPATVRAASPATKVLLLAAQADRSLVAGAIAAGADGLVTKDVSSRQVIGAIDMALKGRWVMVMGSQPLGLGRDAGAARLRLRALSGRERELLGLLARGWSTRRIAQDWQVAEGTVRSHVRNLLVKLGLHCKLEAAAFAWEHGIVVGDGLAREG